MSEDIDRPVERFAESEWTLVEEEVPTKNGWIRTLDSSTFVQTEAGNDRVTLWISTGVMSGIDLTRPQVDELIRMLILARSETWPSQGLWEEEDEG